MDTGEEYEGSGFAIDSAKLVRLRKDKPWSRARLAREAGLSAWSVKSYERGYRRPRAESLEALCRALGCEARDLMAPEGHDDAERADVV
jgi:transcriptional regulator with XRE-family HTH domain